MLNGIMSNSRKQGPVKLKRLKNMLKKTKSKNCRITKTSMVWKMKNTMKITMST